MESMASGGRSETAGEEEGQIPLDIDNVHLLLQVEQEQIQKRTFTNWINAQLAKHRPPTVVLDLFTDVRDGNRLLDLLEVISGQPMSRERGRSIFQCRANIETALTFLRRKSIKLVNINIPDIIEGKPSIVLGLIWTIILHFHIEELANSLAFSSRQSSMESLASIDSCSTIDSSSSRRSGTLHTKFKLSAKKALLLWAREQCQKAGDNISIKDFKSSWRSGLAFLAILNSLRPNLVDLQKTKSRTNRENLEKAFRTAEHELKIPRLLEPEDVDINDPDDKSIMTYVAQFLQYSKDLPVSEEEMQGNLNQKVKGVTSWLTQAEQELEGSIGEADKESYEEKFHAFQTFVTTFNEQKRPIMPLLTAMRKTTQLTEDQVRLKEAWNKVTSKIREYKVALDLDLPSPLDGVGVWLQKIEPVLGEEIAESQDHEEVAGRIRDTLHLLKSLMEEMDVQWQTLQKFPNKDENGATRVPQEKMDELKRRFTSARVTAKYHGIKLEYQESKHSVQALICAVNSKLNTWKKKYGTKESVKLLQLDWHDFVEKQSFVTCLEAATEKLKLVASNYTSRTALAVDSQYINKFLKQVDCDSSVSLASIRNVKAILARVVSGWDTYTENYNLLQQWLKEAQAQTQIHTAEVMSDWSTRHGRLNEAGNFLMEVTNEQISSQLSEELKKLNRQWADFIKRTTFEIIPQPCESPRKTDNTAAINIMIDEATQILHELVDISASSLRTYIKRLEDLKRKIEEVDLDFILQSPEKSPVEFPPVKNVKDTLSEIADKCSGVQQDCQLLLSHVVTLESSLALLELWESEAGDIFNSLNTKQKGQEIEKKSLQLLITRGKEFERQVATAQEIVLIVAENIAKNRSLHHLQASGLQSRVNAVKDTLQVTMTNLNSAMQTKEASSSLEADIKLRFESSKQKLQAYITDALALLSEKHTSEERVAKHEETLTRSETNILEEFLEATEQIKQITPSNQQQEVEKISKYLREQWEAIHVEIPLYLHLMKFEVEKGKCNGAVSQCEMQINKEIKLINSACIAGLIKEHQACFSPEGSLGQADDHLQAMKGICEKLTADSSYSLTKTQLTECEQRKEEIEQRARHVYENLLTRHNEQQSSEKRQSSGHAELKVADVDSPVEAVSSVSSKVLLTTTQVTVRVANIPVVQHAVKLNVEETVPAAQDKQDSNETEVLKSYRESKSVFEVQLKKNRELILSEFPEDMVDTSVVRIKCQELQAAQEETETFWFEFEIQSSQLKGNMREPETRKRINHEWRELKPSLQARLKSMETTVGILVPVEIQVTQLSDLLDQYQKKPKTLKRFTVTGADSVQKDIKELQERIQRHIVNSSVLEKPGSPSVAGLDSRDQLAIHKIVLVCKKKLQKMICSIHDSEVVMKTLEAFLASLRTAENDIDRLPAAPSADVDALRKSKVKLEAIQKDINFMRDKAVHIDELLNKAELCLQEAESSKAMTCQQMIAVLSQKLEDTKEFIMKREQSLQQEEVLRPILVRKADLIKNLREVQQKTDSEGLKEPTLPALQQRLRSFKELRNNLGSFEGELLKLRETANQLVLMSSEEKAKHLVDLETLWEETERSVTDRLKSMETAVGFLVPLDNEVAQLSDSLDQFKKRPKTLKRFTMPGAASVQKDLKERLESTQCYIRNNSAFEKTGSPAVAGLDPRDQQTIQSIVLVCKNKLEEIDHSVHDSEVAMKTLEAFLASLRTAENDIDHLQAAPSSDVVSLCKSKVELEAIQQDINSMRDKAVHIDELLNKAEICLQEAESSKGMTCQQMIVVLSQKLGDTKEFIMKHEQNLQQEVLRSILVKKNALMTHLQEVQEKADSVGLMELTLPALHKRLRILEELENQMRSCEGDLQRLRERANQILPTSREEETMSLVDLDTLWEETERTVTEGQEQCSVLMGLLKKFQGYRSDLSNTLQRAETTISEQASYMGKENLLRLIEKVNAMDCETIHTAHSDFQLFFCALLFFHERDCLSSSRHCIDSCILCNRSNIIKI